MTTNRITQTRQLIRKATYKIKTEFIPETITLEVDITPDATLYVDILAHISEGYPEIEITGVDVLKDTERRAGSLVNIARHIGDELDEAARIFNHASYEDFKDWCYQQQLRTLSA